MDKFEIRPGVAGDEEEMARIDLECFPEEPWSVESFRQHLAENPFALYILAEDPDAPEGEKIMGYAGVWMIAGEGHITNVAVREKYRREGIGNVLMRILEHHCRLAEIGSLTLEVRPSNDKAIRLYERNGFKTEGRRKKYYENNGEDSLIMWKILDAPQK
jgi:ribosomal-protein-alanine N-acetyltransferase